MLKVGMKALVIGCHTPEGEKYIGSEVQIHQIAEFGDQIDPGVIEGDTPFYNHDPRIGATAIVYREGLKSIVRRVRNDFACFDVKHLMPIPPLEDPGIDECTFTPIVQKETA